MEGESPYLLLSLVCCPLVLAGFPLRLPRRAKCPNLSSDHLRGWYNSWNLSDMVWWGGSGMYGVGTEQQWGRNDSERCVGARGMVHVCVV